ncbi:MAG: UDP-N-acetylglucosamine 1-carboxyvinyltransferase [Candidatus Pacebacteria bacterium]|nr:UDP-N-acetylglucosamine 1-carboxyvinyltransferase [Candidatus Paceibacterota bacterium]
MSVLRINGGKPLCGTVQAAGNKNAVLPMIAAALLTDEPVTLRNVPDIGDVRTMLSIADAMGVTISRDLPAKTLTLTAANITEAHVPERLCTDIRAGVLFTAPLLYRTGTVRMPPPGGDVIGRRRLDAHFVGLSALGTTCDIDRYLTFSAPRGFVGNPMFLPEASVTATEHLLLAASVASGQTVIQNSACEPHVQDLCHMLNAMGARIEGIGTNTLTIQGSRKLTGVDHTISSDFAEAGSFLALAAATGGEATVTGIDPTHYCMADYAFERLGVRLDILSDRVHVAADQDRHVKPDPRGGIPQIDDGPWPQFPSDLMSVAIVLATQVRGTVLFFEKMYESRMYFVDRLVAMGANAVICDPHRVVVSGPACLQGIQLNSPDIRAGIALLGGALCASGTSIVRNVDLIDRGYEHIEDKLRQLGADITREHE